MSSTSSISGLVSGLDTTSIISKLMQVEAAPQTQLKTQLATQQSTISSLQSINAKFASLATKAQALDTTLSWTPVKATSSNENVTATADAGTTPATLSLHVNQVATASTADYGIVKLTDQVTTATDHTVTLTDANGKTTSIDTGDGTVQGMVKAINAGDYGLRATLVQTSAGSYRLQVSSTATGPSSAFTLSGTGSGPLAGGTSTTGQQASIAVGSDTITSDSNTFTDLMPGVDVTLDAKSVGTDATVTVASDTASATSAMQGLVSAANDILSTIDKLTAYDASTKTAGPLSGDPVLRQLRNQVLDTVTNGSGSLASLGIQLNKTGSIDFDSSKFSTAYAANPGQVATMLGTTSSWSGTGTASMVSSTWRTAPGAHTVDFAAGTVDGTAGDVVGSDLSGASGTTADGLVLKASSDASGTFTVIPGFASRLEALAQQASDSTTGSLSSEITGMQSSADDLQTQISDWDTRLQAKQAALQKQFNTMEVALGTLQNQASWLSGQIAQLPSGGLSAGN